jgi:hypothetical protein
MSSYRSSFSYSMTRYTQGRRRFATPKAQSVPKWVSAYFFFSHQQDPMVKTNSAVIMWWGLVPTEDEWRLLMIIATFGGIGFVRGRRRPPAFVWMRESRPEASPARHG